jgi:hypothetical protein
VNDEEQQLAREALYVYALELRKLASSRKKAGPGLKDERAKIREAARQAERLAEKLQKGEVSG